MLLDLLGERVARQESFAEHDEGLHDPATDQVGALDRRRFEHGRVTDQGGFNLERRDAIAARIDHVVVAALEPEVAVLVACEHVARVVPLAAEDLRSALGLVPILFHHAWMRVAAETEYALNPDR